MNILTATDGSDAAARAVDFSVQLAAQTHANLHLCYAVDYIKAPAFLTVPRALERPPDLLRIEGLEALESARCVAVLHGIEATTSLREGEKVSAILRYAFELRADLIVAGSSGRGQPAAIVLGSTAIGLARRSEYPIIALPPHASLSLTPISKLAVAVDGSASSHHAFLAALNLARACDASLELAFVVDVDHISGAAREDEIHRGFGLLASAANEARLGGITANPHILEGARAEMLAQLLRSTGSSLLAMGTHHRSGISRLASLAEDVLIDATVPILFHS